MSPRTPQIWILHRDDAERERLARRIGAGAAARVGSPTDIAFESEAPPRAVVLGLADDIEVELEFAHRNGGRLGECRWLLVTRGRDTAELERLFDTLDARVLREPLTGAQLREAITRALPPRVARDSLSLRRYRDRLSERFVRWFDDLGVAGLLRAMDPKLARVPLVVRGEPGTGRALFARYVHTFGGDAAGGAVPFVEIDCATARSEADLLAAIAPAGAGASATLLLEHLERLEPALRGPLLEWIEYGLPPGTAAGTRIRWAAALPPLAADEDAHPDLLSALAGLAVAIPPLRERTAAIPEFARATISSWSNASGRPARELADDAIEALELHVWPGNLRELEEVLVRALVEHSDDPVTAAHLRIDPDRIEADWIAAADDEATAPQVEETARDADEEQDLAVGVDDGATPKPLGDREIELVVEAVTEGEGDEDEPGAEWIEGGGDLPLIELVPADLAEPETTVTGGAVRGGAVAVGATAAGAGDDALEAVDSAELIEALVDTLRAELAQRNLVVLKELERRRPHVLANPVDLRLGLRGVLANLVLRSEDEGELYIASHHNPAGLNRGPALRILVRHIPGPEALRALSPQLRVELALCEKVAEAAGGVFTLSEGGSGEVVVVFDLPAPEAPPAA